MNLKKELPLIIIVLLPFIYLAYVWDQLPEKIPVQWGINGEISRYGDKIELLLMTILLPLFVYIIFLIAPKIDPKNKLTKMGNKFQILKFLVISIQSILALLIIYYAEHQSIANPNYIVLILGVLYIVLGNYFQTVKANYFIGIRTPWTLENETVWNKTHKLAGKMWFGGGILAVLSSLILNNQQNVILFLIISGIITIIPVLYSYLAFKNLKQTT